MSGGTDSSVSAILLKEQGYEVVGITFVMSGSEIDPPYLQKARELACKLNITHHSLDVRPLFKEQIINYFIDEYLHGRTPHPCVRCNNLIKWPILFEQAEKLGCYYIATGHYVQIKQLDGIFYITQGVDPDKDQSFFLWGFPQYLLSRTIFPLGNYLKTDVRRLAEDRKFSEVAKTKDSMGICFLPKDYRPFLKKELESRNLVIEKGNYYDENGQVVGSHPGYPYFTIGQRRGLGINLNRQLYVTGIDPNTNAVFLGPRNHLLINRILVTGYHFSKEANCETLEYIVRIRYRKQATPGIVKIIDRNQLIVSLAEPVHCEASGQTATFYLDDRVAGGGWIEKSWLV